MFFYYPVCVGGGLRGRWGAGGASVACVSLG